MMNDPVSLNSKSKPRRIWLWLLVSVIILGGIGYIGYKIYFPSSLRWIKFEAYKNNPDAYDEIVLRPGTRCGDAPFYFPTTGAIFGLWDQSYRPGHRHQGLDIFPGTELNVTGVYAAYSGYLTRLPDWKATMIIRIPSNPLNPGEQIWTYYTHMADEDGNDFIDPAFPKGTFEQYVEAGTFLGYVGNYSGDPNSPTGLHLHFSIAKDDGEGNFMNEFYVQNTYDPTPYFNLDVNHHNNSTDFPVCKDEITVADWDLMPADEWLVGD